MDGICNIKSIRTSCVDIHLYCWLNCWVLFVDKIQIGRRSPSKGSFSHIFESDDVVSTNNFSAWNCREHKILTSWYYAVRRWINRRGNGTKFMLTYSLICRLNATPAVTRSCRMGPWGSQNPVSKPASELEARDTAWKRLDFKVPVLGHSTYWGLCNKVSHMYKLSGMSIHKRIVPSTFCFVPYLHGVAEHHRSIFFCNVLDRGRLSVIDTVQRDFCNWDSIFKRNGGCRRSGILCDNVSTLDLTFTKDSLGFTNEEPKATTLLSWLKATFAAAFAMGIPFCKAICPIKFPLKTRSVSHGFAWHKHAWLSLQNILTWKKSCPTEYQGETAGK